MGNTLRAAVMALLDRKLSLLAELEQIDADLRDGYAALGTVPSIKKARAVSAQVNTSEHRSATRAASRAKVVTKVCRGCQQPCEMPRSRTYCAPCLMAVRQGRAVIATAARVAARQRTANANATGMH